MTEPPTEHPENSHEDSLPEQEQRRFTLKEAAERTGRSVTTLRRYVRAGRLRAEMTPGRFGPEYTLDDTALGEAGLPISGVDPGRPRAGTRTALAPTGASPRSREWVDGSRLNGTRPIEELLKEFVPADLYRELAMKHEQLLVQYGMIRAGGQRLFEIREEAERASEELRRAQEHQKELQDRSSREIGFLRQHLRQAELEIEQRNMELLTLREKVRILELMTRNAITTESIEKQFLQIFEKEREIDAMLASAFQDESTPDAVAEQRRRALQTLDRWLDPSRRQRQGHEKLEH